jgi:hypothetical protein
MNAVDLIRAQHAELDALLGSSIDADGEHRAELLRAAGDRFEAHATIEEKVFYPAFATGDARGVLEQYAHDHQRIRRELGELAGRPLDVTSEAIAAVRRTIRGHAIEEEEAHLLPVVERTLTAAQLEQLGADMQVLYDELMQRGAWRALEPDSHHATL